MKDFIHDLNTHYFYALMTTSSTVSLAIGDSEELAREKEYFDKTSQLTEKLVEEVKELAELDQKQFVRKVDRLGRIITRLSQVNNYDSLNIPTEVNDLARLVKDSKDKLNNLLSQMFGWGTNGTFNFENHLDIFYRLSKDVLEDEGIELILEGVPSEFTTRSSYMSELDNLIGNAIKHGDPERIEVKVEKSSSDNSYIVMVRDDGYGIDAENVYSSALAVGEIDAETELDCDQKKALIFERKVTTSLDGDSIDGNGKFYGASKGQGMSMIKASIEDKGGRLWFESELGRGTTFYFTIPVDEVIE